GQRILEPLAGKLELGAVVLARLDLGHGSVERHVDTRADARLPRGPGDRLAVVAGARGDDSRAPLVAAEERDPVDRAPDLERAGALEVLRLQPHLAAGEARQRLRPVDRSDARDRRETLPRLADVTRRRSPITGEPTVPP